MFNDLRNSLAKEIQISQRLNHRSRTVLAILGTAGIGKSCFFLYCLNEYLNDATYLGNDSDDVSFYYQTDINEIYEFKFLHKTTEGESIFDVSMLSLTSLTDSKYPLFADLQTRDALPRNHVGITIIYASFRSERYKEVVKEGWKKVMPTWSNMEVEEYVKSKYFCEATEFNEFQRQSVYKNCIYFGGSFRNCIQCVAKEDDPELMIKEAMELKGQTICEHFFVHGFGGHEEDISDTLIHRNPILLDDGNYDFNHYRYDFASPYVLKKLTAMNAHGFITNAKQKYTIGTFSGAGDGIEFELLCFHSFQFSGLEFNIIPLNNTSNLSNISITFPDIEVLQLNWRTQTNYLSMNKLYIPPYGNLESGDAFCVMMVNGILTLIIVQCTIAEEHPIKKNGVEQIYECFKKNSSISCQNAMIVFVTPVHGKLTNKQSISTQSGTVSKKFSKKISSIENCQFKLENPLIHFETNDTRIAR